MRLQLIRYESVELTEQLMRERQRRRAEDEDDDDDSDSNHGEGRELEAESAAASEVHAELRGVLLEEQRSEEPNVSTEEGGQEGDMLYVLTKGLSQAGEDSVLMQLQDTEQQQGMLAD